MMFWNFPILAAHCTQIGMYLIGVFFLWIGSRELDCRYSYMQDNTLDPFRVRTSLVAAALQFGLATFLS